jgi:hypothetical protein
MPWSSTTRSTLRAWRSLARVIRCSRERPRRSSLLTTRWSPRPGERQRLVQCMAPGQLAARLVDEDLPAARSHERVALAVEVLVPGRHPPVADANGPTVTRTG